MNDSSNQHPTAPRDRNITWNDGEISAYERENLLEQRGCVVWLTGLSGAGKSTLARALEASLSHCHLVYVLDGDNVRHGLNSDLSFTPGDRDENIRRIGEVAALFADAGVITIVAFISPYRTGRDRARATAAPGRFFEIHVHAPVSLCEQRDPKDLYRRARRGEISHFTGITAPYEPPLNPELIVDTGAADVMRCTDQIVQILIRSQMVSSPCSVPDHKSLRIVGEQVGRSRDY